MSPKDVINAARLAVQADKARAIYAAAVPVKIMPFTVGGIRADLQDCEIILDAAATSAMLNALDLHLAERMKAYGIDPE